MLKAPPLIPRTYISRAFKMFKKMFEKAFSYRIFYLGSAHTAAQNPHELNSILTKIFMCYYYSWIGVPCLLSSMSIVTMTVKCFSFICLLMWGLTIKTFLNYTEYQENVGPRNKRGCFQHPPGKISGEWNITEKYPILWNFDSICLCIF